MPDSAQDAGQIDTAELFASIDPLLPRPAQPETGTELVATLPDGRRVTGTVYPDVHAATSVQTLWQPRLCWEFTPFIGDTGRAGMAAILAALRSWLTRSAPEADSAADTGVSVFWPSRDVTVAPALLGRGFVPQTALAVRMDRQNGASPHEPPGVVVRTASPGDLTDLVAVQLEELRYTADVIGRPVTDDAEQLLATSLERALRFGGRVLLAETDGITVGAVAAGWASPTAGTTIQHRLPAGRWGYIGTMSVIPAARGAGVGRALTEVAHRELARDDLRGMFLFYEIANPLSSVFWPRRGYRPLWTKWVCQPASTMR